MHKKTRLAIFCVLALSAPFLLYADLRQNTEKELRNHYRDNTYILRNFYDGSDLKYDVRGDLLSGGRPGIWSLDGFFNVKRVKVKKDKIMLEGTRLLWSYDQKEGKTVYYRSRDLNIQIGPFESVPDASTSYAAIQNVFLQKNEFSASVPRYWRQFVQKVFEESVAPDPGPVNGEPVVPWFAGDNGPKEVVSASIQKSRLIERITPEYPALALRLRVSGMVTFLVTVDEAGIPTVDAIVNPIGVGLEESAIEAISKWRYTPTYLDGDPIPVRATVTVNFAIGR